MGATALLALSGCTSMEDMTGTTTAVNLTKDRPGYYSVQGRYYHCHENGRCHNVRHPNYYMGGGQYRSHMSRPRVTQPR
ncbi:hypothetical protein [Microbulbifer hydrolyticus]|uniref:YHYH domain-containing protein n=1 Tax=Microbulbifer hydrolyticus TaxID=48074 RepID=A0A6P1T878_9GAMM|nr:hypothetical protein [Microbulbifer hydrolyticus]MBB5211361.1 hypothetical protein [Microbulbifer hydrolyticus]QHQ37883.1 hypothetical protein GTQ55_01975 [Microbulbifer hydrolyticus]